MTRAQALRELLDASEPYLQDLPYLHDDDDEASILDERLRMARLAAMEALKPAPRPAPPRPEVLRLSELLAALIRRRDPKARVAPDSKSWLDAIRLLLDVDGRSEAEIAHVIRYSQSDPFWQSNILSAPALRKQFDRLIARAGKPRITSDEYFNRMDAVTGRNH